MNYRKFVIGGVAVLALSGCSEPVSTPDVNVFIYTSMQQAEDYSRDQGFTQEAEYLADGVVTHEEYRSSALAFRDCLEKVGYRFGDEITPEPVNGLQLTWKWLDVPLEAGGRDMVCQMPYSVIEQAFIFTHDALMDPSLKNAVVACAGEQGIIIPDSVRNRDDMLALGLEAASEGTSLSVIDSCILSRTQELFPELDQISF